MTHVQEISTRSAQSNRLISGIGLVAQAFRCVMRSYRGEGVAEADLLRIADTSPHLLADIGFVRENGDHADGRVVWRRGGLVIELSGHD